jgi:hypothetical protein
MMHLILVLASLAQTVPTRPDPPRGLERTSSVAEPGLELPEPSEPKGTAEAPAADGAQQPAGTEGEAVVEGALPEDALAQDALPEDALSEDAAPEEPIPEPWTAPEDDAARQSLLGPWPDGFEPEAGRLEMLPTVDPVTGRILDAGTPMEGELQGPTAPLAESEPDALPEPALFPLPADAQSEPTEPAPLVPPVMSAAPQVVVQEPSPSVELWPFEPPKGGQSFSRSAMWFLIATLAVVLGRRMSGARLTLPKRGLLPAMARVIKVVSRIAALIAVLFGTMRLVPDAYFQYFPVVLVAASVAVGWSARDVLHDVLAGILLVVEHRLVPDMRVEADGRVGTVISVGFRSVSMESDDGQIIRIPNRDFLSTDTRMDKDPFAPVEVVVEAPHGARRRLEEIALASPLVAPGHPPEVFRDAEHPERWVVRARLVHPRWALAFRGAVQDRLEAG